MNCHVRSDRIWNELFELNFNWDNSIEMRMSIFDGYLILSNALGTNDFPYFPTVPSIKSASTANTNVQPDRLLLHRPQQKETPQNFYKGAKANSFEPQTAQITKSFKLTGTGVSIRMPSSLFRCVAIEDPEMYFWVIAIEFIGRLGGRVAHELMFNYRNGSEGILWVTRRCVSVWNIDND